MVAKAWGPNDRQAPPGETALAAEAAAPPVDPRLGEALARTFDTPGGFTDLAGRAKGRVYGR